MHIRIDSISNINTSKKEKKKVNIYTKNLQFGATLLMGHRGKHYWKIEGIYRTRCKKKKQVPPFRAS